MRTDLLLLTPLARLADLALLLLRITAFLFAVAVWMVHWPQDFAGWWPPSS
jgi:hypothetical protein